MKMAITMDGETKAVVQSYEKDVMITVGSNIYNYPEYLIDNKDENGMVDALEDVMFNEAKGAYFNG